MQRIIVLYAATYRNEFFRFKLHSRGTDINVRRGDGIRRFRHSDYSHPRIFRHPDFS